MRAALVQMNGRDGQAQDAIAKRLGCSQSAVTQWINGVTCPKEDKIARMIDAFDIRPRFFTDESLGETPDYRDFVGRSVDRDDAKGTPNAEAYIAGQAAIGRPVSDEHAARLRSIRASTGDLPLATFAATHSAWLAEDAGKVVERRGEPIAAKIDEARGQRRLPPAKPRR